MSSNVIDRGDGIVCTIEEVKLKDGKITVVFKTSDHEQFVPFFMNSGGTVVLAIVPAQGTLKYDEESPDVKPGDSDTELPLDGDVGMVCPECNAPAEEQEVVDGPPGTKTYVCTRDECHRRFAVPN